MVTPESRSEFSTPAGLGEGGEKSSSTTEIKGVFILQLYYSNIVGCYVFCRYIAGAFLNAVLWFDLFIVNIVFVLWRFIEFNYDN